MLVFRQTVLEDEVFGYWLRYEYNSKPSIRQQTNFPTSLVQFIINQDYSSREGNFWRYFILWNYYMGGLLRELPARHEIEWYKATIDEADYRNLLLIASDDWKYLSNYTCAISICATKIENEKQSLLSMPDYSRQVEFVLNLANQLAFGASIDPTLILIGKRHGPYTVIDGVHRCVSIYLHYFLRRNVGFRPHEVYIGVTDKKSYWQVRN